MIYGRYKDFISLSTLATMHKALAKKYGARLTPVGGGIVGVLPQNGMLLVRYANGDAEMWDFSFEFSSFVGGAKCNDSSS